MSFVEKIDWENRNIRKHDIADTTYTTSIINGKKIFQITTFGSSMRKFKGDASQMIQFDEKSAKDLFELLKKTYMFE